MEKDKQDTIKKLDRDDLWSMEELKATVISYFKIAEAIRNKEPINKAQCYRELSARFLRSQSAFERRMMNISYVLMLMGKAWVPGLRPLKNVGSKNATIIESIVNEIDMFMLAPRAQKAIQVNKARESILRGKRSKDIPLGKKGPVATIQSSTTIFARDPHVKAWVLERAKGRCEGCEKHAPFTGADGYPYLEVHHVRHLADRGSDTISNAVALCPNCHRRLHYSSDAQEYRERLFGKVQDLNRE